MEKEIEKELGELATSEVKEGRIEEEEEITNEKETQVQVEENKEIPVSIEVS